MAICYALIRALGSAFTYVNICNNSATKLYLFSNAIECSNTAIKVYFSNVNISDSGNKKNTRQYFNLGLIRRSVYHYLFPTISQVDF